MNLFRRLNFRKIPVHSLKYFKLLSHSSLSFFVSRRQKQGIALVKLLLKSSVKYFMQLCICSEIVVQSKHLASWHPVIFHQISCFLLPRKLYIIGALYCYEYSVIFVYWVVLQATLTLTTSFFSGLTEDLKIFGSILINNVVRSG